MGSGTDYQAPWPLPAYLTSFRALRWSSGEVSAGPFRAGANAPPSVNEEYQSRDSCVCHHKISTTILLFFSYLRHTCHVHIYLSTTVIWVNVFETQVHEDQYNNVIVFSCTSGTWVTYTYVNNGHMGQRSLNSNTCNNEHEFNQVYGQV